MLAVRILYKSDIYDRSTAPIVATRHPPSTAKPPLGKYRASAASYTRTNLQTGREQETRHVFTISRPYHCIAIQGSHCGAREYRIVSNRAVTIAVLGPLPSSSVTPSRTKTRRHRHKAAATINDQKCLPPSVAACFFTSAVQTRCTQSGRSIALDLTPLRRALAHTVAPTRPRWVCV